MLIVCSTPFEGEMQCVEFQLAGLADYIYSPDGDVFALGGNNIITELQKDGKYCSYRRDAVLSRETMEHGRWNDFLPELSCLRRD